MSNCSRHVVQLEPFKTLSSIGSSNPGPIYRGTVPRGPLGSAFLNVMGIIWEYTPRIVRDHMEVQPKKQKGQNDSALRKRKGACTP